MARNAWRRIVARLALLIVAVLAWARPLEVQLGRVRYLVARDGRMVPVMAGGSQEADGEDDDASTDGSVDDDGDSDKADDAAAADDDVDGAADDDSADDDDTADADADRSAKKDENWKAHARKHERDAKRFRREADELKAKLAKHEERNKSDRERELDRVRKDAAAEAETKVAEKYRARIRNAEIRARAATTFADPEDAIKLLDLEDDAVFDDDGEVQADVIEDALSDLLDRKPHLRKPSGEPKRRTGSADAGKGSGARKGTDDLSVDEHFQAIRRNRK